MRLDENRWIAGGRIDAEWRWVSRRRLAEARRGLRAARVRLARAPAAVRGRRYAQALETLLRARGDFAERVLTGPSLDYWISLGDSYFAGPVAERDLHLYFGALAGFAAAVALEEERPLRCGAVLDPEGRLFLHGTPLYFEFKGFGKAEVSISASRGALRISGKGIAAAYSRRKPAASKGLRRLDEIVPGIVVADRGWLQLRGVTMHGLAVLDDGARAAFAASIRRALGDIAERVPFLRAEMSDCLHLVAPLLSHRDHSSVSSSYTNMRGLIALSHSDDPLLQAETLIHEFCHMKMNQLLAADPVLLPGQSGQVYYSPWRPDARRLRGLFLGAHAFLNVARYLSRSLEREEFQQTRRIELMTGVAWRAFQAESALRSLSEHGAFTEFGARMLLGLWRELGLLRHAMLWFPPALLAEQRAAVEAHRRDHALADTALHKDASSFSDLVARPAFQETHPPAAGPA